MKAIPLPPPETIIRIRSENSYCTVFTTSGPRLFSRCMASVLGDLPHKTFVKTHKGHAANVDFVRGLSGKYKTGAVAIMSDGSRVPVSRREYSEVKGKLNQKLI